MRYLGFFGILLVLLVSCQNTSNPNARVNGIYSGGLYSNEVGFLGGFAIDVSTSGTTVDGAACIVGITGDSACNTLAGSISGNNFRFTVGAISFDTTVDGQRIEGSYVFAEGSGTIKLNKDNSAVRASNIQATSDHKALIVNQILKAIGGSN
jgi:hypothetical protein